MRRRRRRRTFFIAARRILFKTFGIVLLQQTRRFCFSPVLFWMQDTKGLSRLEEPRPFVRRRRRRLLLKREIICVLHSSSSSLLYVSILFFVCRLGRSVSSTFGPSKTGKRSLRVLYERYLYHPERVLTFDTFFFVVSYLRVLVVF